MCTGIWLTACWALLGSIPPVPCDLCYSLLPARCSSLSNSLYASSTTVYPTYLTTFCSPQSKHSDAPSLHFFFLFLLLLLLLTLSPSYQVNTNTSAYAPPISCRSGTCTASTADIVFSRLRPPCGWAICLVSWFMLVSMQLRKGEKGRISQKFNK